MQAKIDQYQTEEGGKYAGDKGESMAQLKREHTRLMMSIRVLTEVSGYVLTDESQKRIDKLAAELSGHVQRMDHELMEWNYN